MCLHEHTELRGAKEPTATEPGYTGDLYCTVCGELLRKGEIIPATGAVDPSAPSDAANPQKPGTSPDTGDHSSVMLWSVMGVVALAGAAVLVLKRRKSSAK